MRREPLPEDLKELVALCKAGKLFAVQYWISSGKRYRVPEGNFSTRPLHAAVEVGFHSLVEVLLRAGVDQDEKDSALCYAVSAKRLDLVELLVQFGADTKTLTFEDVICSRCPQIMRWFVDQGVDLETDWPIANAFKFKHREFLGIYMWLRDKVPSARFQATMALRYHVRKGNPKWISLLIWAGADPRLPVPNLDYPAGEGEELRTALEDAVVFSRVEVVRKIGIKPPMDNPSSLLADCWLCNDPVMVELLLDAGADPNAIMSEGERNPMQALIQNFEWSIDSRFSHESPEIALKCIELAAKKGGRWRPTNSRYYRYFRQALTKVEPYVALRHLQRLLESGAIEQEVFKELMNTPRMRELLKTGVPGVLRIRELAGLSTKRKSPQSAKKQRH